MPPCSALIEPFYPTYEPKSTLQRVIYGDPFTSMINEQKLHAGVILETSGEEARQYIREIMDHFDLISLSLGSGLEHNLFRSLLSFTKAFLRRL